MVRTFGVESVTQMVVLFEILSPDRRPIYVPCADSRQLTASSRSLWDDAHVVLTRCVINLSYIITFVEHFMEFQRTPCCVASLGSSDRAGSINYLNVVFIE
ncbi:hypothetical protein PILCRDRAFT_673713 [Piloderma croceum F 1598]|uniref:Uncharacterized protein n=1 Tax=Piloderma croceum (strain F 1598) TaxID=765440 RepID=A0A0C3ANM4_PILCF|nr:hypothetical protein PILCRDRAFT_673713 [Piloderma croceum F 1598]